MPVILIITSFCRKKKFSHDGALRVVDYALSGPEGTDCCNNLVDILGVETIFSLFMKTPNKYGRNGLSQQEVSLLSACSFPVNSLFSCRLCVNCRNQTPLIYPFVILIILMIFVILSCQLMYLPKKLARWKCTFSLYILSFNILNNYFVVVSAWRPCAKHHSVDVAQLSFQPKSETLISVFSENGGPPHGTALCLFG